MNLPLWPFINRFPAKLMPQNKSQGRAVLQFELTPDDYVAANFLHSRWTWTRWLRSIAIALALLGFALYRMPNEPLRAFTMIAIYVTVLAIALMLYRYVYLPWRSRRMFMQTKALQRRFSWSWNDEQLSYKTDLANGIVPWTNLASWRENDMLFALYASPIAFFLFPKRAFESTAAVDDFRALVRAKVMPEQPPQAMF